MRATIQNSSRPHPRISGFTMIEMIIAAGIALFIFSVGFFTISGTIKSRSDYDVRMKASESARMFYKRMDADFAAAIPGPGTMELGRCEEGDTPQRLVFEDDFGGVSSDVLQFYTKQDSGDPDDPPLFVRYFVSRYTDTDGKTHATLCRSATSSLKPEDEAPETSTLTTFEENSLFENADTLAVDYMQWDEAQRKLLPMPAANQLTGAGATHIRMTLRLKVPLNTNATKPALIQLDTEPVSTDAPADCFQFQRVFPIPQSFKP